jgi:hypothetical protein
MLLKESQLLSRFYTFRDDPHMQILSHADHRADDTGVIRIHCAAGHKRPIDLQRVNGKAF